MSDPINNSCPRISILGVAVEQLHAFATRLAIVVDEYGLLVFLQPFVVLSSAGPHSRHLTLRRHLTILGKDWDAWKSLILGYHITEHSLSGFSDLAFPLAAEVLPSLFLLFSRLPSLRGTDGICSDSVDDEGTSRTTTSALSTPS
jgi:hypothetical protein